MINLIGCSKENFYKLLELMNYKLVKKDANKEVFFKYQPKNIKNKKNKFAKKITKNNPFEKLSELRFR